MDCSTGEIVPVLNALRGVEDEDLRSWEKDVMYIKSRPWLKVRDCAAPSPS